MKPYLVMVPGWGMNEMVWGDFSKLLKKDYELVFIQWHKIKSLTDFKGQIIEVIEEKNIKEFSLLGWSLGTLVCQEIARVYKERITSLILISATSRFVKSEKHDYNIGWDKIIIEKMSEQLCKKKESIEKSFYNKMFSEKEKEGKGYKSFLEVMKKNNNDIEVLKLGLKYLVETDVRESIKSIMRPTLLIHGEKDRICPLKSGIYIKSQNNQIQLEVIKDAGHIPFYTKNEICIDIIKNFTSYLKEDGEK